MDCGPCPLCVHQLTPAATTGTLDLTNSATYGKCNVVYVGIVVTEAQKLQLQTCECNSLLGSTRVVLPVIRGDSRRVMRLLVGGAEGRVEQVGAKRVRRETK